jgi:hypothetical protein
MAMWGLTNAEWIVGGLLLLAALLWVCTAPRALGFKKPPVISREIEILINIDAPPLKVWEAIVDWESQSNWMALTEVWVAPGAQRAGVGARIEAFTGLRAKRASANGLPLFGFLDTMTVTRWEAPTRCDVLHTGTVVKGSGTFIVEERANGFARFRWSEIVELPFGYLGALLWPFARIGLLGSVKFSLKALARSLQS